MLIYTSQNLCTVDLSEWNLCPTRFSSKPNTNGAFKGRIYWPLQFLSVCNLQIPELSLLMKMRCLRGIGEMVTRKTEGKLPNQKQAKRELKVKEYSIKLVNTLTTLVNHVHLYKSAETSGRTWHLELSLSPESPKEESTQRDSCILDSLSRAEWH